jgi:hypothetical protein
MQTYLHRTFVGKVAYNEYDVASFLPWMDFTWLSFVVKINGYYY